MRGDDLLDSGDDPGTELLRVDADRAVDVTGENVLPAGQAFGLELFDRDVLRSLPVVLGDAFGDRHVDGLSCCHRLRRLHRPAERAGDHGMDPLEGQVLGEMTRLVLARFGEFRVCGALETLHP